MSVNIGKVDLLMHEKLGSLRKCNGCLKMLPKENLIRIAKFSNKIVSLDILGDKPGRGAYLCKDFNCFKLAKKTKRFERSLSCKISNELYDKIEEQLKKMDNKLLSFMGIVRKAGSMVFGNDCVAESILKNKSKLILLSSDLSPRSANKIKLLSEKSGVTFINIQENMEDIYRSIGKKTGIISIEDCGFSEKIKEIINERS